MRTLRSKESTATRCLSQNKPPQDILFLRAGNQVSDKVLVAALSSEPSLTAGWSLLSVLGKLSSALCVS